MLFWGWCDTQLLNNRPHLQTTASNRYNYCRLQPLTGSHSVVQSEGATVHMIASTCEQHWVDCVHCVVQCEQHWVSIPISNHNVYPSLLLIDFPLSIPIYHHHYMVFFSFPHTNFGRTDSCSNVVTESQVDISSVAQCAKVFICQQHTSLIVISIAKRCS